MLRVDKRKRRGDQPGRLAVIVHVWVGVRARHRAPKEYGARNNFVIDAVRVIGVDSLIKKELVSVSGLDGADPHASSKFKDLGYPCYFPRAESEL